MCFLLALPDTSPLSKSNICSLSTVIVSRVFQRNIGPKLKTIGTSQKASTWNKHLWKSNYKTSSKTETFEKREKKKFYKAETTEKNLADTPLLDFFGRLEHLQLKPCKLIKF